MKNIFFYINAIYEKVKVYVHHHFSPDSVNTQYEKDERNVIFINKRNTQLLCDLV